MFDGLLKYDLGAGVEAFSTQRDAALPYPVIQGHQVHDCKVAIVDRPDMTRQNHQRHQTDAAMIAEPFLDFSRREQLREWLTANHASASHAWVACNRSITPKPDAIPYVEIVEECLCFGWIDSTLKQLADGRLAQRISPRRKGSHWTMLNLERCAKLEQLGLMTDAGRKVLRQK